VLCIAAPLESADISFGRSVPFDPLTDADFVRLESQFVVGECSPGYFGNPDSPPGSVVTTADSTESFYDLHRQTTDTETGTHVFALASQEPSVPATETGVFRDTTEVHSTVEHCSVPAPPEHLLCERDGAGYLSDGNAGDREPERVESVERE
jgi:hypothetical protein